MKQNLKLKLKKMCTEKKEANGMEVLNVFLWFDCSQKKKTMYFMCQF